MAPTMLGVVLLVFLLFNWVGGDPAYVLAGKISNQEQIDNIRRQLGVDQPYYIQLWIFVKQILTADFGASWSTNETVSHILATRLGPSLMVLIPLLILVTITAIDVDSEMNRAIVFYDSLVGEEGDEEIVAALAQHRVRIQSSVGRQVRAKKTPILTFKPDDAIRAAERIERILHDKDTLPERPVVVEEDIATDEPHGQA